MAKRKTLQATAITPVSAPPVLDCQLCDKPIASLDISLSTCCNGRVHIACDAQMGRAKIPPIRYPTDAAHDRYERDIISGKRRNPFTEVRVSLPGLYDMTSFQDRKYIRNLARENLQRILGEKTHKERVEMLTRDESQAINWSTNPTKVMDKLMQRIRRTS